MYDEPRKVNLQIHVLAILLKQNISLWDNRADRNALIKLIEENYLNNSQSTIYIAATEFMGMLLKYLQENNDLDDILVKRIKFDIEKGKR